MAKRDPDGPRKRRTEPPPLPDLSREMPALDLDFETVGLMLLSAPMVGAKAHHTDFRRGTYRDYVEPTTAEGEFVRDALTLDTEEMCEKWYGGTENAALLVTRRLEAP